MAKALAHSTDFDNINTIDHAILGGGIIRELQLNRPSSLNSISKDLLNDLWGAIQVIQSDDQVRCLLLSGIGRAFCTGADLKERATMSQTEVQVFLDQLMLCFNAIADLQIPTIAVLGGYALGGGLELALCFDLRIAISDFEKEKFIGLPETSLGIIPGAGGTQRLSRIIGSSRAKEMIFTAQKISAKRALQIGLANRIEKQSELMKKSLQLAQEICANAPIALRACKQSIHRGQNLKISEALKIEQVCYQKTLKTKDRTEALQAFKEKRKPVFKGE